MKRNKVKTNNNYLWFYGLIFILILSLNIGFSAYQNKLSIENISALVRIDKDIRITSIGVDSTNDATSLYEEYSTFNISGSVKLDNADSYVIYEVEVYNLGNVPMGIRETIIDNDNLKYEFLDYELKSKICEEDQCTLGIKKKLKVKISYKDGANISEESNNFILSFRFGRIFNITYSNVSNSANLPNEVIEDDTLNLTINKNSNDILKVIMNGKTLKINNDYTYDDTLLTIAKVTGDIKISINENSIMKDKIITSFISSGSEDDIPDYSLDNLTDEERKELFSNVATESGLYKTKGINGGDVYAFRGDITNNYVQFGGYLWRIMQIDESGNLKLILDGSINRTAYQSSDNTTINGVENAPNVLGFQNSLAKTKLDSWYEYLSYFSSRIIPTKFCNNFDYVTKTSSGSKNEVNYFQSYQNVGPDVAEFTPSFECPSNYIFEEMVGLISAEEYVFAGGAFDKDNKSFYLYNSSIYNSSALNSNDAKSEDFFWTLTPAYHDTARNNGGVFMINSKGALKDWSFSLLSGYNILRPVITIYGDYSMSGSGTADDPYYYPDISQTATKVDIIDINGLNGNTYFIGHTGGIKGVDGLLSGTISNTLRSVGLLGKNTATFSSDKLSIINKTALTFTFEMISPVDNSTDEYYYYLKTAGGEYLKITNSTTVELSTEPTKLKVSPSTFSGRNGQIIITNEDGTYYLNFYGAASNEGDDKFAAWNELDVNASMSLYKPN